MLISFVQLLIDKTRRHLLRILAWQGRRGVYTPYIADFECIGHRNRFKPLRRVDGRPADVWIGGRCSRFEQFQGFRQRVYQASSRCWAWTRAFSMRNVLDKWRWTTPVIASIRTRNTDTVISA